MNHSQLRDSSPLIANPETKKLNVAKHFLAFIKTFMTLLGTGITLFALIADWYGMGDPGFGPGQREATFFGLTILIASFVLRLKPAEKLMTRYFRIVAMVSIWLAILAPGVVAMELYARHIQNYLPISWLLKKSTFIELDRLKVYNRAFYEENRAFFRHWPIKLELFDNPKPTPRYLFKPNLRMARHGNRLVPAKTGEEVYWSSNSWGFRGAEFSIQKPPQTIRIVCLGASTTEGSQGDHQTYPYYLEQELKRLFPNQRIEVINAGHHAHSVDSLLEILRQRVLPLNPDIVIFYEAANSLFQKDASPCPAGPCWLKFYPIWYRWFYRRSALFVFLSDRLGWSGHRPPTVPRSTEDFFPRRSALFYKQILSDISRETLNHGSLIVLTSFITFAQEGAEISYQANPLLFHDLYKNHYPLTPGEVGRIYQYFNQQSAEVAREFNVPYADIAAEFPKDPRYFPFDIIHLSPEGNQLLAHLLAKFLGKEVLPKIIANQ